MKFKLIALILGLMSSTVFVSCDPENLDELTETEDPYEPTEVTLDGNYIQYTIDGVTTMLDRGFCLVNNHNYHIASDTVTCKEEGLSLTIKSEGELSLNFRLDPNGPTNLYASFRRVVNSDTIDLNHYFWIPLNCEGVALPDIQITFESDNFIEGYFEAEFFEIVPDGPGAITCEELHSGGIIRIDFALPKNECPYIPPAKNYFQYSANGNAFKFDRGYGIRTGDTDYFLASDSIVCAGNGSYTLVQEDEERLHLNFQKDAAGDTSMETALLERNIAGNTITLYSGGPVAACSSVTPEIEIYLEQEDFIEGTYRAEFFEMINPGADSTDCNNWQSAGVIDAQFAVALVECP